MFGWFKKTEEERIDHTEAEQAHARAEVDKGRAAEKWIDVADTLRIVASNGFGLDLREALKARKQHER